MNLKFNIPVYFTDKHHIPNGSLWGVYVHLSGGASQLLKNEIDGKINDSTHHVMAGLNRGELKQTIGYRNSPTSCERDVMYANGVNPLMLKNGLGLYFWGDKIYNCGYQGVTRIREYKIIKRIERHEGDLQTLLCEMKVNDYIGDFYVSGGDVYIKFGKIGSLIHFELLRIKRKVKLENYYKNP